MLSEFYRVLKPGGIAIISTPNFPVNSPTGKVTNPFHTQEFVYEELKEILESVFPDVKIMGQKYVRYEGEFKPFSRLVLGTFHTMGIRKLPFKIKNGIVQSLTGKPLYPTPEDYKMVTGKSAIIKCKTFFCICRK